MGKSVADLTTTIMLSRKVSYNKALDIVRDEHPEAWRNYLSGNPSILGGARGAEEITVAGRPGLRIYGESDHGDIVAGLPETLARYRPDGLVGEFMFPVFITEGSDGYLGMIPVVGQYDGRIRDVNRGPGAASPEGVFNVTSVGVLARGRGLHKNIPVEYDWGANAAWRYRESVALALQDDLLLAAEDRVATLCTNSTNVSTVFLPTSSWSAAANAGDAFAEVETGISHVASTSGLRPNRLVFGSEAWPIFAGNSAVIARVGGPVSLRAAADALRVDEIRVAEGRKNLGAGTVRKFDTILPADDVWIFRGPARDDSFSARWALTAVWRPLLYAAVPGVGRYIPELRPASPSNRSTHVEVHTWETERVVDSGLAVRIAGVGSAQ